MTGILESTVAVVTGGTQGIGRAIAAEYLAEGATVVVVSRSGKASYITGANVPVDGGWTAH